MYLSHIDVSLPLFLAPFLSLEINKIFFKKKEKCVLFYPPTIVMSSDASFSYPSQSNFLKEWSNSIFLFLHILLTLYTAL